MDYLKTLLKNTSDFISRMSPSQVVMLLGVVAGTIVGAVLVVGWLGHVSYARLYSNLDESEAAGLV